MLNIEKVEMHIRKNSRIFNRIPIKINDIPPLSKMGKNYYAINIHITINGTEFSSLKMINSNSTPEEVKKFYELYDKFREMNRGDTLFIFYS